MATPAIGVFLPTMSARTERPGDVVAAARHAEDLDFESGWVVDQLVAGTGVPFVDSTVALAAAAGATERLLLAYGVMILPLRPVVWAAKQVASLQTVSDGRALLGVGVGGDRHDRSWAAAGVPRTERGRRTDQALDVLADLVAGRSVELGEASCSSPPVSTFRPSSWAAWPMPPSSGRWSTATAGSRCRSLPPGSGPTIERLGELATERGRATPSITGSVAVAIDGDPTLPDRGGLVRRLSDPDGMFGMPAEAVPEMLVTGGPSAVAERISALSRDRGRAGGVHPRRR